MNAENSAYNDVGNNDALNATDPEATRVKSDGTSIGSWAVTGGTILIGLAIFIATGGRKIR